MDLEPRRGYGAEGVDLGVISKQAADTPWKGWVSQGMCVRQECQWQCCLELRVQAPPRGEQDPWQHLPWRPAGCVLPHWEREMRNSAKIILILCNYRFVGAGREGGREKGEEGRE